MRQSRRNFLQGTGFSIAAGGVVLAAGGQVNSRPLQTVAAGAGKFDVIVVGGGLGGLTAARELSGRGLSVALYEARNRLGGRAFTSKLGDYQVELGGKVIHWSEQHMWAEVTRYGLPLVVIPGEAEPQHVILRARGQTQRLGADALAKSFIDGMGKYLEPAVSVVPRIPYGTPYMRPGMERFDRVTVVDRLKEVKLDPISLGIVKSFMEALVHGPTEDASLLMALRYFGRSGFSAPTFAADMGGFTLGGGMSSLVRAIADDAKANGVAIHVSAPVTQIDQAAEEVRVTLETGETVTSRFVIMAVPLNTWSRIKFTPELSAVKQRVTRERHLGQGMAFVMRVKNLPGPTLAFGTDGAKFNYLASVQSDSGGTIVFGYGRDPNAVDINDPQAMQLVLREFLPEATVAESFGYDWNLDPYSLGTWFYPRAGWYSIMDQIIAPEGRLHFAGADVAAFGWQGSMAGAIESGILVSQRVAGLARSPSATG